MSKLVGNYKFIRNENLDKYYAALGVPYVARKMMSMSSPTLEIAQEDDNWIITTVTTFRTVISKFKLGEEYEESMPGGNLKSITVIVDDSTIKTDSIGPNETKIMRTYLITEEGCVITFRHEASNTEGKRFFKRVQ